MQPENQKLVEPKIYSLVIESPNRQFLSVQFAYSLEDAFLMARNEFEIQNPKLIGHMLGAKIGIFSIKTIGELFFNTEITNSKIKNISSRSEAPTLSNTKPVEQPIVNEHTIKNSIMQLIIETKDMKIFEENKKKFTKEEIKYIQNKLTNK